MTKNALIHYVIGLSLIPACFLAGAGNINPVTNDLPAAQIPQSQTTSAEVNALDNLIDVTEKNLESQKKLRQLLLDYQKLREDSLKDPNNKEQIDRLVTKALEIQILIQNNHLFHVFDAQFLSELNLFSQIASKRSLPAPNQK